MDSLLCVSVRFPRQPPADVRIDRGENVSALKQMIAKLCGVDPSYYRLVWRDTVLQNEGALEEYAICNGDYINIQEISFDLLIQGPAPLCEDYSIEVNHSTRIDSLRLHIATRHDYSNPADIDLRWNNEMLLSNKTVGHYGLMEQDLIIVAERITSRLAPVQKRKPSSEVECSPFYSPTVERKISKPKMGQEPLPYDPPDTDEDGIMIIRRSESMPDLLLPSPEVKRKKDILRKASAPVTSTDMYGSNFKSEKPSKCLPTILS